MKEEIHTNDSYVTVQFSRFTSSPGVILNGSVLRHSNAISLTIRKADETRDLHRDWVFGHNELMEVWLSPIQFAELLTQMNVGTGIPGTMRYFDGKLIQRPEGISKAEQFSKETKELVEETIGWLKDAVVLSKQMADNSKPPTKAERQKLAEAVHKAEINLSSNMGFLLSQFSEQMSKTVADAKASVEEFVTQAIHKTGLEVIRKNAPQIEG
jgi:hypothetical protein